MRVLQIHDNQKHYGGAETYFFNLVDLLKSNGHQVFSFTIEDKCSQNYFGKYFSMYVFNFKVYFSLGKFIRKINPDIIHIHNNYLAPFSVLAACRKHKTIQSIHDYNQVCPLGWAVYKDNLEVCKGGMGIKCLKHKCVSLKKFLISYFPFELRQYFTKKIINRFLTAAQSTKNYLKYQDFKNIEFLPYFINIDKWQFDLAKKIENHIVCVASLAEYKGVSDLMKSMLSVLKKINKAKLTIIGDGPQKKDLIDLSQKLKLANRVNFVGRVPCEGLQKYYQSANVVVVPSIWMENSPLVVFQAMACGRPVIGTNRGGIPDLIQDRETGFIVEAKNPSQIAEKIIKILSDENLFIRFSIKARERAKKMFSAKKHYRQIERIYKNLINEIR